MAEKIERVVKTTEEVVHRFYCDKCGADLGSSVENADGWYSTPEWRKLSVCIPGTGWLRWNGTLCDGCYEKFLSDFCNALEKLGFEEDA